MAAKSCLPPARHPPVHSTGPSFGLSSLRLAPRSRSITTHVQSPYSHYSLELRMPIDWPVMHIMDRKCATREVRIYSIEDVQVHSKHSFVRAVLNGGVTKTHRSRTLVPNSGDGLHDRQPATGSCPPPAVLSDSFVDDVPSSPEIRTRSPSIYRVSRLSFSLAWVVADSKPIPVCAAARKAHQTRDTDQ